MALDPVTGSTLGTIAGSFVVSGLKAALSGTKLDRRVRAALAALATAVRHIASHTGHDLGPELADKLEELSDGGRK